MPNTGSRLVLCFKFFLFFLLFFSVNAYAVQTIYTIQTGSFDDIQTAQDEFNSLVQTLDEKLLDALRIEKVGNFYCVRIGKFEGRAAAEALFPQVKAQFPPAVVMDAYFIEERIEKLYKSSSKGVPQPEKKPSPVPAPEKIKPTEAEKPLKEAGEKIPKESLEKQLRLISELVDKKEYEKALEIIKAEIDIQPASSEIQGWYGTVLLKMNRPATAITYFQRAAELSPQVSDYHNGIGYCLFYLNRFNEAINEFNKAINLNSSHIDALAGLGVAYMKSGNKSGAMDIYNKLKNLDSDTANKLLKIIEGRK